MQILDNLVSKLEQYELSLEEFNNILNRISKEYNIVLDIDTLNFLGLPVTIKDGSVYLKTSQNSFKDEVYCIVDIETNGNSPIKNQIIELGAIKMKNGEIVDSFESYVFADFIPPSISKLTNITKDDLKDAPSLKDVLYRFKLFLGDTVFVAHNVQFDYSFISTSLKVVGMDALLNRKLCSVDLAKKTIDSPRHGLAYLREHLSIEDGEHHRAYADALSAAKVLQECFKNLPENIKSTEELISFSQPSKSKKKRSTTRVQTAT
jgi:DNA polymerase-3 subunit epsilon